jgi:hypothetical protein
MKACRTLLIVLLLGLPAMGWAQDRVPVTFYLVDGSELEGYVKPIAVGANSLSYSIEPKGKLKRMQLKHVYRLVTSDNYGKNVYEVVNVLKRRSNRSKGYLILIVLVDGYMKLYTFENQTGFKEYFIKKSPDAAGAYRAGNAYFSSQPSQMPTNSQRMVDKKFHKTGAWFFEDNPQIVKEINEKQVGTQRMVELVIRYNLDKEKP